jgi:hypothetical protein
MVDQNGFVTLEWQQWFQNPNFVTATTLTSIIGNSTVSGNLTITAGASANVLGGTYFNNTNILGYGIPGIDGEDGDIGIHGNQGNQGLTGRDGLTVLGIDGVDGEDGLTIPGAAGLNGINGYNGTSGLIGADGEDGELVFMQVQTVGTVYGGAF